MCLFSMTCLFFFYPKYHCLVFFWLFWVKKKNDVFIYLSALGLSCGMWDLIPQPGIKPGPPALGVWSLSHWTTREVPGYSVLMTFFLVIKVYYTLLIKKLGKLEIEKMKNIDCCLSLKNYYHCLSSKARRHLLILKHRKVWRD